jgi:hypothetical protein
MSDEAKPRRAWLAPVCLLAAVVLGGMFLGRTAQQPRGSRTAGTSAPQVSALAPDSALPPSTPAFSPAGLDLVGRVVSTQGDPVPGAKVLIDAAGPRVGRGYT